MTLARSKESRSRRWLPAGTLRGQLDGLLDKGLQIGMSRVSQNTKVLNMLPSKAKMRRRRPVTGTRPEVAEL